MGFAPYLGYSGVGSEVDNTGSEIGTVEEVEAVNATLGDAPRLGL